jgi:hypothetical protein
VSQACGADVREEHELLAHVADIVIDGYAVESAIGRAEKMSSRTPDPGSRVTDPEMASAGGNARADLAVDIVRIYTSDAIDRVAHAGKQIVNALSLRTVPMEALTETVARVREQPGVDTVGARRRVAEAGIAQSRYCF